MAVPIDQIQFGLAIENDNDTQQFLISVDISVKELLNTILEEFEKTYDEIEGIANDFSPSEIYPSSTKICCNINEEYVSIFKAFYEGSNQLPPNQIDLEKEATKISYYFVIYKEGNEKIIGIKRATYFKSLLKRKGFLIAFGKAVDINNPFDTSLKAIPDNVFKLDNDFDFIIRHDRIDILHPSSFIYLNNVEEIVLKNIASTASNICTRFKSKISFPNITPDMKKAKTIAKLLSAIKSRNDLESTSIDKLKSRCEILKIKYTEENDVIIPENDQIIDFLEILDRRAYDINLLMDDTQELYRAASRTQKK